MGMFGIAKTMAPRFVRGIYRWVAAPQAKLDPGAQGFAFEMPTTLPLIKAWGPAKLAGQMSVIASGGRPAVAKSPLLEPQGLPQTTYPGNPAFQESVELTPDNQVSQPQ
jgi:hypothetical protein